MTLEYRRSDVVLGLKDQVATGPISAFFTVTFGA